MEYRYQLPIPSDVTGEGVIAAVIDTGVAPHPDFQHRIIAFKDFVNDRKILYDDNGHGTHVAGILAGNGMAGRGFCQGIAPQAGIVSLKVLDHNGNGNSWEIIKALDWLLENYEKYHIRIVNISIGTLQGKSARGNSVMMKKIDELWNQNLCIFAAAGNAGPGKGSITSPGINRKVITVGCCESFPVIEYGKRTKTRYSGRGPVLSSCIMKPEIIAYGKDIISCNYRYLEGQKPYIQKSGTSMAAPMAAGSAALLLEKYPNLTNAQVKLCFRESCIKMKLPANQQGWGLIQPDRLLEAGERLSSINSDADL